MNPRKRRKLVKALLACDSISEKESRQTVIKHLRDDIKNKVKQNSKAIFEVAELVDTCLDYPGGLEELVEIIHDFEGDSSPIQAVFQTIARIFEFELVISYEQHAELLKRAIKFIFEHDLSTEELLQLYKHSLSSDLQEVPEEPTGLFSILKNLWDIRTSDGIYASLLFIERLAYHSKVSNRSNELTAWTDNTATFLGIQEQIAQLRQKLDNKSEAISTKQPSSAYLLIDIYPEEHNINAGQEKLFFVEILLWRDTDNVELLYASDTPVPLKKVSEQLNETYLNHALKLFPVIDNLTFEFFLPNELISHEVDQWLLKEEGAFDTKWGTHCPIVVRSRDRAIKSQKSPFWYKHWTQKWELFQFLSQNNHANSILWIRDRDQYEPESLCATLRNDEQIICLGLLFMPTDNSGQPGLLTAILQAGMPVVLWPRADKNGPRNPTDVQAKIEAIVSDNKLSELPKLIHKERQQAASKNKSDLENYLTLLWDNPNRLPDKFNPTVNRRLRTL